MEACYDGILPPELKAASSSGPSTCTFARLGRHSNIAPSPTAKLRDAAGATIEP